MKKLFPILIIILITVFISCNNSMGTDVSVSPDEAEGASLITDSSKGVVFIDETGVETVVSSIENGETVVCKSVIDYVLLNEDESLSKTSVKTIGRKRAVVLGYRDDGFPGLWIVYSGGIVKPVVNSEDIETSELLEMAEARQPLFKYFGWSYKALDMLVNGNEIIIAGYAENEEGIPWMGIGSGTTIGLYWSVIEDSNGYYHISRAQVVGYRDNSWWRNLRKEMRKEGYRYRWRWLRSLRLFFFGWYDRYMTMTETVEIGENPGEYKISGTDDEGTASVAVVTVSKVLSIEEAPDDPDPPNPIIGPAENNVTVNASNSPLIFTLELGGEINTENPVEFKYSIALEDSSIDIPDEIDFSRFADSGELEVTYNPDLGGEFVTLNCWTERGGQKSAIYRLQFLFEEDAGPAGPPNPVIGPSSPFRIYYNDSPVTVQLELDGEISTTDPVEFKYSFVAGGSLTAIPPEFDFSSFSSSGEFVIIYNTDYEGNTLRINFWTERGGESSTPYMILFYFNPQ